MTSTICAQWPAAEKIKIVHSAQATPAEMKILKKMALFFAQTNPLLAEDMLVTDEYAKKFFTYYTKDFLVLVGKNNLLLDVAKQGIKLNSPKLSYTEQGVFKEQFSYLGIAPNPLFLKARYLGIEHGVVGDSLIVYGGGLQGLDQAFENFKKGIVQGTCLRNQKALPTQVLSSKEYLWGMAFEDDKDLFKTRPKILLRRYVWKGVKFESQIVYGDDIASLQVFKK
ncbi:hypothetical protein PQO03_20135 [Lentisphaera profundi]|uniref:Uncharacterized protein n=1 Tax=Lentisphaera profundi TaxID=1658616 RepID=A0ABY7VVN4_9BACT|nr:hypothetical protein [Lentisphaera profundi]WDE98132.1 hypothetical protein PQO03_20135 [Lentisphaera profundi]